MEELRVTFVYDLYMILRMVVCNPQNRGRSKKTEGWTALKSSLAEGSFKELVPPLPPGVGGRVGRAGCR